MDIKKIITTFFECFQSSKPELLDYLNVLCRSDCILNQETLPFFIDKRKKLFINKVYEDFYEYEKECLSSTIVQYNRQLIYVCKFHTKGIKDKIPYEATGTKTFIFEREDINHEWKIISVNYYFN